MSADRKWPEGVPGVPLERSKFYALHNGAWDIAGPSIIPASRFPRIEVWRGRVIDANAAARALGIIPDEEQNNER